MSFLRVPLLTLISYYLLLNLGFCEANQNCRVALTKITTVDNATVHGAVNRIEFKTSSSFYSNVVEGALAFDVLLLECNVGVIASFRLSCYEIMRLETIRKQPFANLSVLSEKVFTRAGYFLELFN